MNIDELQSVKSQERQSDTLQQLRASFYEDAGEFIQQLREQRDQAASETDDPFSSPEVQRLTNEIETAERTVEDIYDRRVGKLVKMASFAAADMPVEDEGLTKREEQLFGRLVDAIEQNREQILTVLDGEDPEPVETTSPSTSTAPESPADGPASPDPAPDPGTDPDVGAADLMGDPAEAAPDTQTAETSEEPATTSQPAPDSESGPEPEAAPDADDQPVPPDMEADGGTATAGASRQGAEPRPGNESPVDAPSTAAPVDPETTGEEDTDDHTPERTTLRITRDVGEIMGVDERSYDLVSDDVVTLPAENAEPLLQKDAAERLD